MFIFYKKYRKGKNQGYRGKVKHEAVMAENKK